MATVSKFANANTVVTTGWTSPTSGYTDDAAYATAAPAKSTSITSDYGFAAFATSELPESLINSVTFEIQYKSNTTASTGAVIGLQGNNNGSLLGSETTFGMNLSDQTVTKQYTSGISRVDLLNANFIKSRVRGFRSTSNTAITWSVDYVKITVDYTWQPTLAGITSAESLGMPSIAVTLGASGIATSQAVGVSTIAPQVVTSAIPSNEALGALSIASNVSASGIGSSESVGSTNVAVVVSVSGVAGSEQFGQVTISDSGLQLAGVPSAEAVGVISIQPLITPAAVASTELFGESTIMVTLSLGNISSSDNIGASQLVATLATTAIASSETCGNPSVAVTVNLAGINSTEAEGLPVLALNLNLAGIVSDELVGSSWIGSAPNCSPAVMVAINQWWRMGRF